MAFNDSFYVHEYEINHVKEVIGISSDDLNKATEVLLDYIKDDIDNLDVEVVINGQQKQMYNQREIDHMVDVKALYLSVRNISYGAFALVVIIGAYILFDKNHNKWSKLYQDSKIVLMSFLGLIAGLSVLAITDFTKFWHGFHKIFFTNDLWLLDPRTDNLINMVPAKFFFDLIFAMVGLFVTILVLYIIVVYFMQRKEVKR